MAYRAVFLASLLLTSLTLVVNAQEAADKKTPPAKSARAKAAKTEDPDPVAAERRLVAISLLTTLADEARSYQDGKLRARMQARIADALWETDVDKARGLFRRAWETAETEDAETRRRTEEELRQKQGSGPAFVRRSNGDLRAEVLRLAAKRDPALVEEFLAKLQAANDKESADAKQSSRNTPFDDFSNSTAAAKRLQLARSLLDDGDVERAMMFAQPALNQVNRNSISFLSALRVKNPQTADAAFGNLLSLAERDPMSDANTVSGLSSYVLTPAVYITYSADGGASSMRGPAMPPPELPPALRIAFFRVASEILLRPLAPPDQDQTTSGRVGTYMVIQRLLPFFDQFAPDKAALLRAQVAALSGDVPEGARGGDDRPGPRAMLNEDAAGDPLEKMQDRLDHAGTADERDAIYADYAVVLANKGDARVRDLVNKIENADTRKSVQNYTDFQLTQAALRGKNALEAARLAKTGELTNIQRVWAYTTAARMLMNSDKTRALELLDDAAAEARRIGSSDPDRARSLVAVATGLIQVDRVRGWETISEAVKAANSAEDFTGEDSGVSARLQTKRMVLMTGASSNDFDLLGVFRALARDDLFRAIDLAKTFKAEAPRAVATISIARAILEKNNSETAVLQ